MGLCLCSIGFLLATGPYSRGADWLNAGPLFEQSPLTLGVGQRTEVLGPLFYFEQNDTRKTWALPPLFSYTWDTTVDYREVDFLYPVSTSRRYGREYRWHICQLFSFAGGKEPADHHISRFTLFPVYFQQRSPVPEENYTALFPLYGHLKNRVYRDESFFVLFPLYARTRKGDVITDNYLYPLFHLRHGEALHGWQLWPLAGYEHRDPTWRTNGFGDLERLPGHDRKFALWPLYFHHRTGLGTENPLEQYASLPLYVQQRSPLRDSTTVLWPFFSHVTDRERGYREWQLPWPFVIIARGEGKNTTRFFPFYSHAQNANLESAFFLWPLYKLNCVHSQTFDRERTRILLFLYSNTRNVNWETRQVRQRVDLWPLFSWTRDYNGSTRLQLLAPLEPILPASKSVQRNYSPLWSVWRSEKNTKTGATSQSLLWNLYRHDTAPGMKKCSLLFGLFQYQCHPDGKRLRLFYIPVVNTRTKTDAGPSAGRDRGPESR